MALWGKDSQELVGLRQLSGERDKRAELEGRAGKARTEKWEWRLQDLGLGSHSTRKPPCFQ